MHLICIAGFNWPGLVFAFKNMHLQMNYIEVDITKDINHFITVPEGGLVFFFKKKHHIHVSLKKCFILV